MSGAKSAPGGLTATARESDTNRRNGSEAATLQMSHRLQSLSCSCNKQPSQGYLLHRPFLFIFMMFHKVLVGVTWFNSLTVLTTATSDTSPFWGKLISPTVIYFQQKWHTKKNMLTSYHSTSGSILDLKKRFQKMI